jgi:hypothetical protein
MWIGQRLMMALAVCIACALHSQAGAAEMLNQAQVEVLAPLVCESCVPKSKLLAYRGMFLKSGASKLWDPNSPLNKKSEPTENEVGPRSDTVAIVATDDVRPLGKRVCLGRRIPDVLVESARPWNSDNSFLIIESIPEIKAVCVGELQELEVFLQGVVDAMFMARLQKYEAALNKTAVDEAIKASLQSVIFQYQTQWAVKVKADVLAELKKAGTPTDPAPPGAPQQGDEQPQVCLSGNLATCPGKPASVCCQCIEADGKKKVGTCGNDLAIGSWKPKPTVQP